MIYDLFAAHITCLHGQTKHFCNNFAFTNKGIFFIDFEEVNISEFHVKMLSKIILFLQNAKRSASNKGMFI